MENNMALVESRIKAARPHLLSLNVGATLDIPTGKYVKGLKGENILNGGFANFIGIVGIGNSFKSTIAHYYTTTAASRTAEISDTNILTYDTEINIEEQRLANFMHNAPGLGLKTKDVFTDGTWTVTNKAMYPAEKFWSEHTEFISTKKKMGSKITFDSPFYNRDGQSAMKMTVPTFLQIDSFTELEGTKSIELREKTELGSKDRNTMFMGQGMIKTHVLMDIPSMTTGTDHYAVFTAHIGKDINMATGPGANIPTKKLAGLRNGDTIKGVTDKFLFLSRICWQSAGTTILQNPSTKGPEFPKNPIDNKTESTDLHKVTLRTLRNKHGPTHVKLELIVSQIDGVLPELTEFWYIKNLRKRFGLTEGNVTYSLVLYPNETISRTTVRGKLLNDAKMRRALNFTSELAQIKEYWHDDYWEYLACEPQTLYDELKEMGYNWDILLDTRGYWLPDNYNTNLKPYLSTKDLLEMRIGVYVPYWYPKEEIAKIKDKVKKKYETCKDTNVLYYGNRKAFK